ncbi:hypothetical protein G6F65_021844 [Rhizopus arrhizus]|nr:hypothetical protein G6F65_021844 [Rhizopus arrhizus]
MRWSSVRGKVMSAFGQAQHLLGDDVSLDLGRAGKNGFRARPQGGMRQRRRLLVSALRQASRFAQQLHRQFQQALVRLAPVDLGG